MTSANSVRQYERRSMHSLPAFISSPHNDCCSRTRAPSRRDRFGSRFLQYTLVLLRFATVYTVNVFLIGLGHLNKDKTFEIVTIIWWYNAISSVQTFHPSRRLAVTVPDCFSAMFQISPLFEFSFVSSREIGFTLLRHLKLLF